MIRFVKSPLLCFLLVVVVLFTSVAANAQVSANAVVVKVADVEQAVFVLVFGSVLYFVGIKVIDWITKR